MGALARRNRWLAAFGRAAAVSGPAAHVQDAPGAGPPQRTPKSSTKLRSLYAGIDQTYAKFGELWPGFGQGDFGKSAPELGEIGPHPQHGRGPRSGTMLDSTCLAYDAAHNRPT